MQSNSTSPFGRFRRLDSVRRRLLAEAVWRLTLSSVSLAVQPFRRAIRAGAVPLSTGAGSPADCVWAVEAAARRMPWRPVCIHKGLAVQRMVRARGYDARLHYGIGKDAEEGELQAHVWVTLDAVPLIGGEEARQFAAVAVYP